MEDTYIFQGEKKKSEKFIKLNKNVNFEKFKTFDFRIKNQLIVK